MAVLSVNRLAMKLVRKLCDKADEYGLLIKTNEVDTCIIDAGINTRGGFIAGKIITEICLGGLGKAHITTLLLGELELPSIEIFTDQPAISTLGSQLAGWHIKSGDYSAVGSGPARALAMKPKSIYEKIDYKDMSDEAVIVLEASKQPPKDTMIHIAEVCGVSPGRLFVILVPTSSIAGFVQISGRVVETGLHKLTKLGLDPRRVKKAKGHAPIMPMHPDIVEAMGRANDAILYGGATNYIVECEDDEALRALVNKSVSSASKQYGRPFAQIFREARLEFYKIDPDIFAPAMLTVNNVKTGETHTAGRINLDALMKSMGF